MNLSHRIKLDPTIEQIKYFVKACGTARLVWNWALVEWQEQYKQGGKPNTNELARYFNSIKHIKYPWIKDIHRSAHSRPFKNLKIAFDKFFNGTGKYPQFKSRGKSRDSFYISNDTFIIIDKYVRLPKIGLVKLTEPLRFQGKITSATINREVNKWFISINVELSEKETIKPTGQPIGIDLGLTTFATISTGEKIEAPKPLKKLSKKLRRLSRQHSRKQLQSNNRRKSQLKLARLHYKIKNIRKDFQHKLSTRLCKNHAKIHIEDLNISGMVKNRCLSKAISDAGWSEFRRQLTYKSLLFGCELIVRDRFFASSKLCSECGHKLDKLPLSVREWVCPVCGCVHDRDVNAAINISSRHTEGYSGIYASGDCSSDKQVIVCKTMVDEGRTTIEGLKCPIS